MIQIDFFREDDTVRMQEEIQKLRESNDRIRKSLFAKHGELAKNYLNLAERLEIIERNLCNGLLK